MSELLFEWDEGKALENEAKHKVSFEEGKTVFNDSSAITISDPDHSVQEERWMDIGLSAGGRLMVVWYIERGESIRIIGCRKATKTERRNYEHERTHERQR